MNFWLRFILPLVVSVLVMCSVGVPFLDALEGSLLGVTFAEIVLYPRQSRPPGRLL
jgi:hypothetical protein